MFAPKPFLKWGARLGVGFIVLWPIVAFGLAKALVATADLPRADALVVLGGSAAYVERTRHAARLYKEGRAPKIVMTNDGEQAGWSSAEQRNPFFVELAQRELQRAGVPREAIEVLPQPVSSTYDEALLLREYAAERRIKALFIVTSAYHTRRARWIFGDAFAGRGVSLGFAGAAAPGRQSPNPAAWWFEANGWRMVAGEYLKLIYYWLHHGSHL